MSSSPATIRLKDLPSNFPISLYLSKDALQIPKGQRPQVVVDDNDNPIEATHLVVLALNRECRKLGRGTFYHLPLRQDPTRTHAGDVVFVDARWDKRSTNAWDQGGWAERLRLCEAVNKITSAELVIPVCTRILGFDAAERGEYLQPQQQHPYMSRSDPAVKAGADIISYSRSLVDQSRVLLLYPNHHSAPYLCLVDAAEQATQCTSFPTPGDLSETHIPHWQETDTTVFSRKSLAGGSAASAATSHLLRSRVANNRQVVRTFLDIWNDGHRATDSDATQVPIDWNEHGSTKCAWADIKAKMARQDTETREEILKFWPKE